MCNTIETGKLSQPDGGALNAAKVRNADWLAAAICGGIATAPLVAGIIGWASHWNAYTNLTLTLGSGVLWLTLDRAWKDRRDV